MSEIRKGLPPEESCGYQVRATHRVFERLLFQYLREYGIKPGFWYLLRVLWEEEGISQRELSNRAFLREPSTVSMLDAMSESGLVIRKNDKEDRRKYCIYLTRRGSELKSELLSYASMVNDIALQGVSENDRKTFLQVSERMRVNLQSAEARSRTPIPGPQTTQK